MITSRHRLLARLNHLEKNRIAHQRSVNKYKRDLLVKIYGYQVWVTYLIFPAFLCGWTFARMRGTYFNKFAQYLARFVILGSLNQAKNWIQQAIRSDKH